MVVVLPAPLGPMKPKISPRADVEADVAEHFGRAEASARGGARMTGGPFGTTMVSGEKSVLPHSSGSARVGARSVDAPDCAERHTDRCGSGPMQLTKH